MRQPPAWSVTAGVLLVTGLLTLGAAPLLRDSLHYPQLTMLVGNELQLDFVKHGVTHGADCLKRLTGFAETLKKTCPTCRITTSVCTAQASPEILRSLSSDPMDVPSARLPDGMVAYRSANPALAFASCEASERQTATAPAGQRVRCFAPGAHRMAGD